MGVIDPVYRDGGVGTLLQLRVADNEGTAKLQAGRAYQVEIDYLPAAPHPSMTVKASIDSGRAVLQEILVTVVPDSQTVPGSIQTLKFSLVLDELLSRQTLDIVVEAFATDDHLLEIGARFTAEVLG